MGIPGFRVIHPRICVRKQVEMRAAHVLLTFGAVATALSLSVPQRGVRRLRGGAPSMLSVAIVVDVEIKPECRNEFLVRSSRSCTLLS